MSFLQPLLLVTLPLIGLPVLIHLVNQRRFQTMPWAAMIFLLEANRLSRGFARLRQWLILAARTLVIAGLIFALARPLASGWLGLAAGTKTDTTIILLDRSPSMSSASPSANGTKLDASRRHLAEALAKLGSDHWVLIDSATTEPTELQSPDDLLTAPETDPVGASANLPTMLRRAQEYVRSNRTGRTDIWICSDMRSHDWDAEGAQWPAVRQGFLDLPQPVRFYLLAFPQAPEDNTSLRVSAVRRRESDQGARLDISLELARSENAEELRVIPVELNIDGARSVLHVEINGPSHELKNHEIPLAANQIQGWGRVTIPADSNNLDNEFFFVYDRPQVRKTLLITETPQASRGLQLAAEITADAELHCSVEVSSPAQLTSTAWEEIGLVVWQAPLPNGKNAELLQSYVEQEGRLLLLPPRSPGQEECFDFSWNRWQQNRTDVRVANWRGDADLLAHTQSGSALPVGELQIHRSCGMNGEITPLATLSSGDVLLGRLPTARGGVYAFATTADDADSSLATDGVVLYVMVQRALAAGCQRLGQVHQHFAGQFEADSSDWRRLAGPALALSHQFAFYSGVYQAGERLLALNRDRAEDAMHLVSAQQIEELFADLDWVRIDGHADESGKLVNEIWRLFLLVMLLALLLEALLCLPKVRPPVEALA